MPDLLTLADEQVVTLWDVKTPTAASADGFRHDRAVTKAACENLGWGYEVFTGLSEVHRHNLLWLHHHRHRPAWADSYETEVLAAASRTGAAEGVSLGELVAESRNPETVAVMWHLIWSGRLVVDLTRRIGRNTQVISQDAPSSLTPEAGS